MEMQVPTPLLHVFTLFIYCTYNWVRENRVTPLKIRFNACLRTLRTVYDILIPRSRVLLEKLIFAQLVKKFVSFYGTRRLITVFKRARHWTLY
jgi:hypothetical protein